MIPETDLQNTIQDFLSRLDPEPEGRTGIRRNASVPLVSVITPSYNQGRFIERTIRSVLNQGWPNLEYIVVDGASADGTPEIVRRYERYLSWWVSEPDRGQTDAIIKGLARATGDYVTWVCSDDVLFPGSLEKMVTTLEAHPEGGIVYGGVAFIDEEDRILKVHSYPDMDLAKLLYERHSTVAQPSSLIRRRTLEAAGGLDRSLSYCMDYDLWIRLLRQAGCVNLGGTVLSGYRLHTRSKTVGSYRNMALEKIAVNRRYTGDRFNRVIWAHYGYIVEDFFRNVKRKWRGAGDAVE
ncbi:MAG: putative glycosyltransferase [Deltaproteobacteria bacterium]|nr:putative glycosyltransferase [Deltaproteobacteria bacterium]